VNLIGADDYGPPLVGPYRVPVPGSSGGFMFARTRTHHHRGVDLVVPVGRPWLAIADGLVEHAHAAPFRGFHGYGRVVVLKFKAPDGSDLWALYAHGQTVDVAQGTRVRKGDKLGTVGRSQFRGGNPADELTMGAHLHFEIARKRYPMGSEDSARIDPWGWFRDRGVPLAEGDPAPAGSPVASAPAPSSPNGHTAKQQVRDELLARLIRTDLEVATLRARLIAAGAPRVAEGLRLSWATARAELEPRLRQPSTLEELRGVVLGWIERIEVTRDAARAAGGAVVSSGAAAAAASTAAHQRELWEAGGWLDPSWIGDALADAAKKFGAGLLVVGLLYLWWSRRK